MAAQHASEVSAAETAEFTLDLRRDAPLTRGVAP
jgi:hypothetical protein